MNRSSLLLLLAMGCGFVTGCGDDDGTTPVDATVTDTSTTDGGADEDTGPVDNGVAGDEIFDDSDCSAPTCGPVELESACTCIATPVDNAAVLLNQVGCGQLDAPDGVVRNLKDDFCDEEENDGAPVLGCNEMGMYRPRGTSEMATMYGVVDVFGNGGDANNISVEICLEGENGMPTDCLPAVTATIDSPCAESEVQYVRDVPDGERQLGFWHVENVPTETPLIVHTSGDGAFWRDIYTYNVLIPNDELEASPAADACETVAGLTGPLWEYRARILADTDWTSIPLTAGLVEGVRSSSGVIAGEIHDCGDVRLENAQVATSPRAEVFTYFNDNPDNPIPMQSIEGTSRLGLYAALDIPEGPVDVAAVGRTGDGIVTLGWYRARVFAGAVTSITLRGLRAHQTPE